MYANGRGVDKDPDEAKKWLERAAAQGVGDEPEAAGESKKDWDSDGERIP
jgi:TPR repeat protein